MKYINARSVAAWCMSVAAAFTIGTYVDGVVQFGCTIRFPTTAGPVILDDANHDCVGVTSVAMDASGNLVVYYPALSAVITSAITVDDALIDPDVHIGASVGLDHSVVKFAVNGTYVRIDSAAVVGSTKNIFFSVTGKE